MTRSAILAVVVGLALGVTLLATNDIGAILATLYVAGWAILLVVALHLPQTLLSALGWAPLIDAAPAPGLWLLYRLRWVRESVNALLPVAQVGGDVVRARLLAQRGVPVAVAGGSTLVDLSMELAGQVAFTLLGVALLLAAPHHGTVVPLALGVTVISVLIGVAFIGAQHLGLFTLVERAAARWSSGGKTFGDLSGLNDAILSLYRRPRRVLASGGWHLASWVAGGVETWAALKVLGLGTGLREAMIIEGLGQAVRSLAFLVPGALGVQEGGYLLICAMFGIAPQQALALSLIRRIRELVLGVPGLIVWHRMERPTAAVSREVVI